jgi:hypothetical protein
MPTTAMERSANALLSAAPATCTNGVTVLVPVLFAASLAADVVSKASTVGCVDTQSVVTIREIGSLSTVGRLEPSVFRLVVEGTVVVLGGSNVASMDDVETASVILPILVFITIVGVAVAKDAGRVNPATRAHVGKSSFLIMVRMKSSKMQVRGTVLPHRSNTRVREHNTCPPRNSPCPDSTTAGNRVRKATACLIYGSTYLACTCIVTKCAVGSAAALESCPICLVATHQLPARQRRSRDGRVALAFIDGKHCQSKG